MAQAEANSRKNRKPGPGIDALANGARLAVLSKELGVEIKRHREPGKVHSNPFNKEDGNDKDETIVVARGF